MFDAGLCRTCLGGDGLAWLGCGSASSSAAMRAGRALCSLRFIFFPFLDAAKGFAGQGKMLHPTFVSVKSNALTM